MADILLHPNHWLFQQVEHPVCPVCLMEIRAFQTIATEPEGKRLRFYHAECKKKDLE